MHVNGEQELSCVHTFDSLFSMYDDVGCLNSQFRIFWFFLFFKFCISISNSNCLVTITQTVNLKGQWTDVLYANDTPYFFKQTYYTRYNKGNEWHAWLHKWRHSESHLFIVHVANQFQTSKHHELLYIICIFFTLNGILHIIFSAYLYHNM